MTDKKRKLVIFLADLTHTGSGIATESIPLNIGLIASYALKKFNTDIQVKLFKYPDALLNALQHEKYDILSCSTYIWNNNLSEWACEIAKKYNPDVVTVRGGWNFPLDEKQQEDYLRKHKYTDIFCIHEGEIAFSNIIERLLNIENIKQWDTYPLGGCVFLDSKKKKFIKGPVLPQIENLDEIPSPYTSGLLDQFFDGNLTPIIETTRGCPFTCNYCNSSNDYYSKVRMFSSGYIVKEINYIAKKNATTGVRNLIIADSNFGMYPRDKEIVNAIKEAQDRYQWPLGIMATTGKNAVKRIVEATDVFDNAMTISMSVQSMNPDTLKTIKRDNIKLEMYEEISSALIKRGKFPMAEVIVPLPCETISSYMDGIEKLINMGAKKITSYTLQLNNGTIYKNKDYRKKYGYEGRFRLIPNDFGVYCGKKVFDYEEVAVFNNSLNFNDYLKIRKFAFIIELTFNNSIFQELLKLLNELNVNNYDFIKYILKCLENAPNEIKEVFDSFESETKSELFKNEDTIISYYSDEKNYQMLKRGEIGGNVIFRNKGMMFGNVLHVWIDYVFDCALGILNVAEGNTDEKIKALNAIKSFTSSKLEGLFSSELTFVDIYLNSEYDILMWLKNEKGLKLKSFKIKEKSLTYRFYFNEIQKFERNDLFSRYDCDSSGVAKIMARVPSLERIFRSTEYFKEEVCK